MEIEICEYCNGKGLIECPMEYGEDKCPDYCPSCGGSQKVICHECNGNGKKESDKDDIYNMYE